MTAPLLVRLLLDSQESFVVAADRVQGERRDTRDLGLNSPGWVVAHASFFHDCWICADGRGIHLREACDPWLLDYFRSQQAAGREAIEAPYEQARAALDRVLARTTPLLQRTSDEDLERVPPYEDGAWPPGTTLGYFVSRAIAHLYAHASELNVIATSAGAEDMGLPGRMRHTAGPRQNPS